MASVSFKTAFLEKTLDILPHVEYVALASLLAPLRMGVRILRIPIMAVQFFRPDIIMQKKIPNAREVTLESIEEGFFDQNSMPKNAKAPLKEKLKQLLVSVEKVSLRLNLKKPVKVYSSEKASSSESFGCDKFSLIPIPLFIPIRNLNGSNELMEFSVGHELVHTAKNHMAKRHFLSSCILATEVAACCIGCFFTVPFIEGAGSLCEKVFCRHTEMEADSEAIKILKTNQGALEDFQSIQQIHYPRRTADITAFQKKPEVYFNTKSRWTNLIRKVFYVLSKTVVVSAVSPEGNHREDTDHPPLTERRVNALLFKSALSQSS